MDSKSINLIKKSVEILDISKYYSMSEEDKVVLDQIILQLISLVQKT